MTTVYFVRHAQPNYANHDDATRELSQKGMDDRKLVTAFLMDKHIDAVLSSPYKRAMDTVRHFAEAKGLSVIPIHGFHERKVDSTWIEDFDGFCRLQWADFDYKLSDGETLKETQTRNIAALEDVLETYNGKTVVIGSHGTAMSTIYHFYDPSFGYDDFRRIQNRMPWIVKFVFDGHICLSIEECSM